MSTLLLLRSRSTIHRLISSLYLILLLLLLRQLLLLLFFTRIRHLTLDMDQTLDRNGRRRRRRKKLLPNEYTKTNFNNQNGINLLNQNDCCRILEHFFAGNLFKDYSKPYLWNTIYFRENWKVEFYFYGSIIFLYFKQSTNQSNKQTLKREKRKQRKRNA